MTATILVAIKDSPAAFVAPRVAIEYARRWEARLVALTMIEDGELGAQFVRLGAAIERQESAAGAVLSHLVALVPTSHVVVES